MATSGSVNTSTRKERYYTFSWSIASQSSTNNSSTINWKVVAAGTDGWRGEKEFEVTINGETVFTKATRVERYGGDTVASGTLEIKHNPDGTKSFAVYVGAAVYTYGTHNVTASTTFTLEPIAQRATITSAPAFTDEEYPTITYSNPAGNAVTSLKVCISADGYNPTIAYRDVSKTGSSYTFNLTDAERLALQSAFPTEKGGFVYFYIQTVLNGTTYTNRMAKWMTIVDAAPLVDSCTVKDTNATVVAATGNEKNCIAGYSNITYALVAHARKGATITEVKAVCGSQTLYNFNKTFTASATGTITFYIRDSRGLTAQYTDNTMNTIPYVKPTITKFDVNIPTDGDVSSLDVAGTYYNGSLGKQVNGCSIYYRYKEVGGEYPTSWSAMWSTLDSGKVSASEDFPLDYKKGYVFQLRFTDRITTVYSEEKAVKALPVFDWGENSFNFNVPVTIEGQPVVDYVVEQWQANSEWFVRKWASGLAEAWLVDAWREYDIRGEYGALYGAVYHSTDFNGVEKFDIGGIFFTSIDSIQLNIEDGGYGVPVWATMNDSYWLDEEYGIVWIYYQPLAPYEAWIDGRLHIHIKGRWK